MTRRSAFREERTAFSKWKYSQVDTFVATNGSVRQRLLAEGVPERIVQDRQCFLVWDFRFRLKHFDPTSWQTVHGGTHLVFNEVGQVTLHRDYWDAAEELYEKLPVVGGLMRCLKRRANR